MRSLKFFAILALIVPTMAEDLAPGSVAYLGVKPAQPTAVSQPSTSTATNSVGEWFGGLPWWRWSRASGDWDGLRTTLETNGLTFSARYTMDGAAIWRDNLGHHDVASGLLDLNLTYDPAPVSGMEGGTLFAQYYNRQSPNGSDTVGDLQGYDNIGAGRLSQAEEIWYEQKLFGDHLRAKVGQVDANAEFDQLPDASEFINSSAGYSPTLLNFPTYPNPAISGNLFVYPTKWLYAGAGVYTANLREFSICRLDHPYLIGEIGVTSNGSGHFGAGKLAGGLWHDSGNIARFDGGHDNGASGFYLIAEQQIWKKKPGDANDSRGISVFAQYSHADPAVSQFENHIGLGICDTGTFAGRDDDAAGVYWTWVGLSRAEEAGLPDNESSLECFYKCRVTGCFSIKPDLQWIRHPGGQTSPGHAWVATVRLVVDI